MKKNCTAVVLAAGKGTRMGTSIAKQYLEINEKPVVVYALEAFQKSPVIDDIILMTDESHIDYCKNEIVCKYGLTKVLTVAAGGKERYESVWKALCILKERPAACEYVFIHDGARPFVTPEIIERAYEAAAQWKACVVGMPVKDTIKVVDDEAVITDSPNRSFLWQAQTPQVFSLPLITAAFEKQMKQDCSGVTDDGMVVEKQMGVRVHMVEGSYGNIKVTTPEDMVIAQALLSSKTCR